MTKRRRAARQIENKPAEIQKRGRGNPSWVRGGPSPNPGGVPREARELRELLKGDAKFIHDALLVLVKSGNPTVTVYAHRQLVGEPPQSLEVSGPGGGPIRTHIDMTRLSDKDLKAIDDILARAAAD